MTLPSLGRLACGHEFDIAAQLGHIADRGDERGLQRLAFVHHLAPERHAVIAGCAGNHQARLDDLGVPPHDLATCFGVTNMPRTLVVWSARPIQP